MSEGEPQNSRAVHIKVEKKQDELEELRARLEHRTREMELNEQVVIHLRRVNHALEERVAVLEALEAIWARERASLREMKHILADEKALLVRQLKAASILENAVQLHDGLQRCLKRQRGVEGGAAEEDLIIID